MTSIAERISTLKRLDRARNRPETPQDKYRDASGAIADNATDIIDSMYAALREIAAHKQYGGSFGDGLEFSHCATIAQKCLHGNDYGAYTPFRIVPNGGYSYDLRLKKDGVTANILKGRIVSYDGPIDKVDDIEEELKAFGFNV